MASSTLKQREAILDASKLYTEFGIDDSTPPKLTYTHIITHQSGEKVREVWAEADLIGNGGQGSVFAHKYIKGPDEQSIGNKRAVKRIDIKGNDVGNLHHLRELEALAVLGDREVSPLVPM